MCACDQTGIAVYSGIVMFGLGKKNKKTKRGKIEVMEIDPTVAEQIHVMPPRFYTQTKQQKSSGLLVILIGGLVLLGGLGAAAWYFFFAAPPAPSVNEPTQPAINQNTNQTPPATNTIPEPTNVNTSLPTQPSQPATTTPTTTPVTNTNVNTNVHVAPTPSGPLPSSADIDSDGLTDVEEGLYGTDFALSDTDGDGYSDGSEVLNGYDPAAANLTLLASGRFTTYQSASFSIAYPTEWRARELSSDGQEVVFQANTGEFIEVLIIANPSRQPLQQWFAEAYPDATTPIVVTIAGRQGLRTIDRQTYFFANGDASQVATLVYNVGQFATTNFATTFVSMIRSFVFP